MTEHNRQFDDLDRSVSDWFRKDLRGLFGPPGAVPPQVDKAIMEQADRRLAKPRRLIVRMRWAAGVAAAAAVILIGVALYNPQSTSPGLAEGRADIDGNGRVDILDAFQLARHIESRGPADERWDLNGDGRVDRDDVDLAAFAAVRLGLGPQVHRGEGVPPLRDEAILASFFQGAVRPSYPKSKGKMPSPRIRWDLLDKGV